MLGNRLMSRNNVDLVSGALVFAKFAHIGQKRKYSNAPYVTHPIEVSELLRMYHHGTTDVMTAAALLYDVPEDTNYSLSDIETLFGSEVKTLVYWLTDVSVKSDGNRTVRNEKDRAHLANAPDDAQYIKLADILHNISNIVEYDRKFAEVYLLEKMALIDVMNDAVRNSGIFIETKRRIQQCVDEVNINQEKKYATAV